MKCNFKVLSLAFFFLITPLVQSAQSSPPDKSKNPGIANDPVGGGAPFGGGLTILLALAIAYGAGKLYHNRFNNSLFEIE